MPCFILVRLYDKLPARHIFYHQALKAGDAVTSIEAVAHGREWGQHGTHTLADDQNIWIYCPDMASQKAGEIFTVMDFLEEGLAYPRLRRVRFDLSKMPIEFHACCAKNTKLDTHRPKTELEAEEEVDAWIETHNLVRLDKKSKYYQERKLEAMETEPIIERPYKEVHDEYMQKTGFPICTKMELLSALIEVPRIQNLLDINNEQDLSVM